MTELEEFVCNISKTLSKTLSKIEVKSKCGFGYIFLDQLGFVK
jgi:hypothetical protein